MSDRTQSMSLVAALRVLHETRQDEIIVTTMGSGREWTQFEPHPLDLVYVPSSMGQATSVGLGLALAQPGRRIVVCNGDGSMLMNLGSLVTITSQQPKNMVLLLFDNGVYEVTGRQATPGAAELRADHCDTRFAEIAQACGFRETVEIWDLEEWKQRVNDILHAVGPIFCCLKVAPVEGDVGPKSPGPAWQRTSSFRDQFRTGTSPG